MDKEDRIKLMEASIQMFISDLRIHKWLKKIDKYEQEHNGRRPDTLDLDIMNMEIDDEINEIIRKAKEESDKVSR